jgi:hypothetical protein
MPALMTEPVHPVAPPAPVPVHALTYSEAAGPRKPGIILALAIVTVVVACLSGLANLVFAGYALVQYQMARAYSMMSATPTAMATPPKADMTLNMSDATAAVNAVQSVVNLDGARVRELNKLLRQHGKDVFPTDDIDGPLTAAAVKEMIHEHGEAPADTAGAYFVTDQGRVDIFSDHAVFASTDGKRKIETSAVKNTDTDTGNGSLDNTLTAAQVRRVMSAVKKAANPPLNAAQLASVQTQVSAANQQLVNPANASPVSSVTPTGSPGNSVMIQFDSGMLWLGPKGEITSMNAYASGSTAFTTSTSFTPPTINKSAVALMLLEAAGSGALAIYLLIVAMFLFRSSFSSPRMLRIYVWLKIPLAVLAGVAVVMVNLPNATTAGEASELWTWTLVLVAVGLAFPIACLLVLRTRTVPEFFRPSEIVPGT